MASYYYLAAQLPYLVYGQNALITSDYFAELCRDHLEQKDLELLASCSLNPFGENSSESKDAQAGYGESAQLSSSPFIDSWKHWEKSLRVNLAKFRAQNLKREFSVQEDASSFDAATIAKAAVTMDSPLEAEMYLDKARWDYIDSLEGLDHFSENAIFAYQLKLRLIERYNKFKEDEGFAEYKSLYASIINQASQVNNGEANTTSNESGEPK